MAEKKKETLAKKTDMVTVYGTGVSKYMTTGKKYEVHSAHAELLVSKGHASKDPIPTEEETGKGGKKK